MSDQANFQFDFALDAKAEVTEQDGDLYIEGMASDWLMDRQDEAFEPGAFEDGLKSFIESNPILVYHHQYDKALGQVVAAENRPNGLWVKARVDEPTAGSWAEDVVAKIRRGTIRGFSVGGRFHRRRGADGRPRIYKVDMGELSVTPFPINPRTLFQVAGKAFESEPEDDQSRVRQFVTEYLDRVEASLDRVLAAKAAPEQREGGDPT